MVIHHDQLFYLGSITLKFRVFTYAVTVEPSRLIFDEQDSLRNESVDPEQIFIKTTAVNLSRIKLGEHQLLVLQPAEDLEILFFELVSGYC
jgi:hypothetical protein